MARLVAPDKGVREVKIETETRERIYRPDKGGVYSVENKKHANHMKQEGFTEASLLGGATTGGSGFICSACGFHGFFRKCGRCQHETTDIQMDSTIEGEQ